ncbi:hypothetical protein K501DRAFT_202846 [Backusella circina FSU 941]|nr:hypothetical protein K501DRAFT_202846 [Backusella circina FSU 941]
MNSTASAYHHHHHHHPYAGYRFENTARFHPQQSITPSEDTFDDEDQIPTVEEFRAIIDDYLNNLSPKKRDKALVDQQRYLLIQQVLRDPRNTAISTAQFRFWVKKMFQLQPGTTDLVCHDNKPVAMKEQIYHILVHAHREAHHGGRDKTSALVRRRFSWIPKELVARFVRHCPFCITRRNSGHSPSLIMPKSSPRSSRYSRHACSFDSTTTTSLSIKEESDLSSGPPSTDSGYEATPNYIAMSSSSSSSPRRPYFSSMYDKEDQDFLDCPYDAAPIENSFNMGGFRNDHSPSSAAASSTAAAAAAAAAALMRSPHRGPDLLSHQDSRYMAPPASHCSSAPVSHSSSSRHFVPYQPLNIPDTTFKPEL